MSDLGRSLPSSSDKRVIIAIRVGEVELDIDDPQELLAWLPISVKTALESTSGWLDEHTLTSLVRKVVHFARTQHLADPAPHCCFRHEEYSPLAFVLVAFLLASFEFLSLTMKWGLNWLFATLAVLFFATGVILYCICVHHRAQLVGEDPETVCENFAAAWSAKHQLPLTFHRRRGGPSYFELRKVPRGTPHRDIEKAQAADPRGKAAAEEDDDGWGMVRTPTACTQEDEHAAQT